MDVLLTENILHVMLNRSHCWIVVDVLDSFYEQLEQSKAEAALLSIRVLKQQRRAEPSALAYQLSAS
eukprot:scaffold23964_cov18-Tisochrysis_lutea.AAC.1